MPSIFSFLSTNATKDGEFNTVCGNYKFCEYKGASEERSVAIISAQILDKLSGSTTTLSHSFVSKILTSGKNDDKCYPEITSLTMTATSTLE